MTTGPAVRRDMAERGIPEGPTTTWPMLTWGTGNARNVANLRLLPLPGIPAHSLVNPGKEDGRGRTRQRREKDKGTVTAEFAVALPAVVFLLALLLAAASAGVTQLRLEEAARAGARALARGDDSAAVGQIVSTLAGASASVVVGADGEWLSVTVTDRVGGPLGSSIPWALTARALSRSELYSSRASVGVHDEKAISGRELRPLMAFRDGSFS